jgi:hypothetical protein
MTNPSRLKKTWDDPIVAEVRRAREAHAAQFNYDLEAIFRDIKAKEQSSGRRYVRYPLRPIDASRKPT